jgi:hypothetical protein
MDRIRFHKELTGILYGNWKPLLHERDYRPESKTSEGKAGLFVPGVEGRGAANTARVPR